MSRLLAAPKLWEQDKQKQQEQKDTKTSKQQDLHQVLQAVEKNHLESTFYKSRPALKGKSVVVEPRFAISWVHLYTCNGVEVYDLELLLELRWNDHRIVGWLPHKRLPTNLWRPSIREKMVYFDQIFIVM